jgi:hypothetical protein
MAAVTASNLSGASAVAAGTCQSLAHNTHGTVWGWGYSGYVQLGDEDPHVVKAVGCYSCPS